MVRMKARHLKEVVGVSLMSLLAILWMGAGCAEKIHCPFPVVPIPEGENASADGTFFLAQHLPVQHGRGSNCIVIEDLDGDGWLDIAIGFVIGAEVEMYGGIRFLWGEGGGSFLEEEVVLPDELTASSGCVATDWDEDGMLDLLLGTYEGEIVALRATGLREYEGVTGFVEYPDSHTFQRISTLVPVDLDGQGAMDLLVASSGFTAGLCNETPDPGNGANVLIQGKRLLGSDIHCLVGEADGSYIPAPAGVCPPDLSEETLGPVWAMALAYLNHDGRPDAIIANDFAENIVLLSKSDGGMSDGTSSSGIQEYNHAMGIALADFDGDGAQDMYITDIGPDQIWFGDGCGHFSDGGFASGIAPLSDRGLSWGVHAADFDLDGDADIFVTNSMVLPDDGWGVLANCGVQEDLPVQSHFLFINDGEGVFERFDLPHLVDITGGLRETVIIAKGDLDRDGDVDLVTVTEVYGGRIFWNQMGKDGHWLSVRPILANGVPALGARVTVVEKEGFARRDDILGSYGSDGHSALEAYFGLGDSSGPVIVQVEWPDGTLSEKTDVEVDQHLVVKREMP